MLIVLSKMTQFNFLIGFIMVLHSCILFSQKKNEQQTNLIISEIVYDSLNYEPLGLVKVYNLNKKTGTSTTFQGVYRLENTSLTDTISFYVIGFQRKIITVGELIKSDTLFLNPESQLIDEVIILADNSILYDIISNCKNKTVKNDIVSKTYMEVKSTNNAEPIELIQGYYNGYFNGYGLTQLTTKNIRMGLRPVDQRMYTSIMTTGVFYEHDLFKTSDLFPSNPLQLSKQQLKKQYHLFLNGKFKENDRIVYVIGFEPNKEHSHFFSGTVWIDSSDSKLYKVVLEKDTAMQHPFAPFWNTQKLSNINLKITKSFLHEGTSIKTNYVDFEYRLDYTTEDTTSINTIKTHASLQAYNYDDSFIEPLFDFPDEKEWPNHELSKLAVIEYDSLFWECQEEFKTSSDHLSNNLFYNDSLTITGQMFYSKDLFRFLPVNKSTNNRARSIFVNWSKEKRIFLKNLGADTSVYTNTQGVIPSQLYHLEAQIYLNINEVCDSVYYSTKTIYDPFKTFYHYPFTSETLVFINVYFDIVEIQRRKLDKELKLCNNDSDLMKRRYFQIMEETQELTKKYFNEVNRGYNQLKMISWNKFVKDRINIDNIELFTEKK